MTSFPSRLGLGAALALSACGPTRGGLDAAGDVIDAAVDVHTVPVDACAGMSPSARCPLCTPNLLSCTDDASASRRCDPDGLGYTTVATCAAGQLCSNGACVDPCADAATRHSYQGCEFYATNTLNSSVGRASDNVLNFSRDFFPFSVVATSNWPVPVTVMVEGGNLGASLVYTVPPNGSQRIDLPWDSALGEGGGNGSVASTFVSGGAFHVRASAPVALYQFSPINYTAFRECGEPACFSYSNDASLVLPVASVASMTQSYLVVTRATTRVLPHGETSWSIYSGFVTIVATGTQPANVQIVLHGDTLGGDGIAAASAGDTITRTLNPGDVLQLVAPNGGTCASPELDPMYDDTFCTEVRSEDLTGTIVRSDQPIAVFAGHDCALVPHNKWACDHLEEEMFPTESLGTDYILGRTPPVADEPNYLRIVAAHDDTTVTFTPSSFHDPITLAHVGDVTGDLALGVPVVAIHATSPVLVAQFLAGAVSGPDPNSDNHNGDPDLILAVPTAQLLDAYTFYTAEDFEGSRAILTVPHGESLTLDGTAIDVPVQGTVNGYDVLYVTALLGPHRIAAVHPGITFGLVVSGVDIYTSYSYPAGIDLTPAQPPL